MILKIRFIVLVLILQMLCAFSVAARNTKIPLQEATLTKLNDLLNQTSKFHEALVKQDEKLTSFRIKELEMEIDGLVKSLNEFQVQNQDMHLRRILKSTRDFLDSYLNLPKDEEKLVNLRKAFAQIVQLVRIYEVDKKFVIYYCKNDNSEWIQEGRKPRNPINPEKWGNCGDRAYR